MQPVTKILHALREGNGKVAEGEGEYGEQMAGRWRRDGWKIEARWRGDGGKMEKDLEGMVVGGTVGRL